MDLPEPKKKPLGRWAGPTLKQRTQENLLIWHLLVTEAYDRTVCTGPTRSGVAMPADYRQRALINRHARDRWKEMERFAQRLGAQGVKRYEHNRERLEKGAEALEAWRLPEKAPWLEFPISMSDALKVYVCLPNPCSVRALCSLADQGLSGEVIIEAAITLRHEHHKEMAADRESDEFFSCAEEDDTYCKPGLREPRSTGE